MSTKKKLAPKKTSKLQVVELTTGKVVHEVDVSGKGESSIERVMSGMLINMDTDRYCIQEN